MTEQEWEDLCDGCGNCCAFAGTRIACPSFNHETNRCKVYENRFEVELCCEAVSPENIPRQYEMGLLPETCAYVRFLRGQPQLEEVEPARLIPFVMMETSEQNRYVEARAEWRKKRGFA